MGAVHSGCSTGALGKADAVRDPGFAHRVLLGRCSLESCVEARGKCGKSCRKCDEAEDARTILATDEADIRTHGTFEDEPLHDIGPWLGVPARAEELLYADSSSAGEEAMRFVRRAIASVEDTQAASAGAPFGGAMEVLELGPSGDGFGDDMVEFKAAKRTGLGDVWFTLLFNESHVAASRCPLSEHFQTFCFRCPEGEPLWSIRLRVERQPSGKDAAPGGCDIAMFVDRDFGLRVRGRDVLHLFHAGGECTSRASQASKCHHSARMGILRGLAPAYFAENAIELIVRRMSCSERIDIFLNGFSVQCEESSRLDSASGARLLRYVVGPLSCAVRSIIVRVAWPEEADARPARRGVSVCKAFGIMVAGYDCLPTAEFYELRAHRQQYVGRGARGVHTTMVQAGRWLRQGDYVLWPYVCTRKPYDPKTAAARRMAALAEREAVLERSGPS